MRTKLLALVFATFPLVSRQHRHRPSVTKIVPLVCGFLQWALATLPASAQVQQAWAARYHGSRNSNDVATAMAVDDAGNVYVTGRSATNSHLAYTTVKYDAQGNQLWLARYTGYTNGHNLATAVLTDRAGNSYVTGASPGTNSVYELATVKYDSNGNQLWVARSQGAGTNVYFLGRDFLNPFLRGFALKRDAQGNVCAIGLSPGESNTIDHVVVKYDGDGHQLSVTRYHLPGVAQLAGKMDSLGRLYVTGWATAKFETNGSPIWITQDVGGTAIDFDRNGNVYVTDPGFQSRKLDAAGNLHWSAYYDGADHSLDEARAIAVDNDGNVFVTGASTYWQSQHHTGAGPDELIGVATVKYGPGGRQLWAAFHNLASSGYVDADILLDSDGHAYVTGQGVASGYPFQNQFADVTIKYDTNGSQVWAASYNGPGQFYGDRPFPTALDSLGNVYLALTTYSANTGADFATVKYTQTKVAGLPTIIGSPESQAAVEGSNVVFAVSATGQEPLNYQWRWSGFDFEYWSTNGFNIAGATNATLILPAVSLGSAGDYSVVVSNAAGLTISTEARLLVRKPDLGFRILAPVISDGQFGFTLNAEPGHRYSIEASTNLTDWRVLHTLFNETEQMFISLDDPMSGPTQQFYRVKRETD